MKKLFRLYSISLLRKTAIRYRLMTSLVLLSLLPLLISGVISYRESSRAIETNTHLFASEIVKQVAKNVQLQMARIESGSEGLVLSQRVQQALLRYDSTLSSEAAPARAELTRILLDGYGSFDYFNQKYFLGSDGQITDAQVFPQLGEAVEKLVRQAPPNLKGNPFWTTLASTGDQLQIVMLREIFSKANGQSVGSLFLAMRPSHFSYIFDNVDLGANSQIWVVDSSTGQILIRPQAPTPQYGSSVIAPALLAALRQSSAAPGGAHSIAFDLPGPKRQPGQSGEPVLASYAAIADTDWYVVSIIPTANLVGEARSVRRQMVLIGLICFACSIALAYLISRSIVSPLGKLIATMQQAEAGNYAVRIAHDGNDELTVLSGQFNEMAGRIGHAYEQLEVRVRERTQALEQANCQLAALSLTDSLTGIANRRRFDDVLVSEINRAARSRQPLALMMIDVDFFKSYNDYYGHQEGDICLRQVAQLLQSWVRRPGDLVARYGGEEFVLLAADSDVGPALDLAENIRQAVETLALPHLKSPLAHCRVTISIGVVVTVPDDRQSPASLIRMADQAMYRAKNTGRNQVALYGAEGLIERGSAPGAWAIADNPPR